MNIVPQYLTAECEREDCQIAFDQSGTTTCMAWSPTYDKHGELIGRGDPNISRSGARCLTCGTRWEFRTQYGKTETTIINGQSTSGSEN